MLVRPLIVILGLLAVAGPASALVITECGTEIPAGETGVLANDLDCSTLAGVCIECDGNGCVDGTQTCLSSADCSAPNQGGCRHESGVTIRKNATLDMQGHAIDAGPESLAVACGDVSGKCRIISTGTRGLITGGGCVGLAHRTKLTISDIDVYRCGGTGVNSADISASVVATNVSVRENAGMGIRAASIRANNVTAIANANRGLSAEAGRLEGSAIEVRDNGAFGAVSIRAFKLTGFSALTNGMTSLEGGGGIWAPRGGKMTNSSFGGNEYQDASGEIPMDVLAGRKPRFTNVSCFRSGGNPGLLDGWGICSGD